MAYGVVVVDDEYWIRSLICSYLPAAEEGFALLGEAADGIDGLDLCRETHPDILITDIKMPGIGGLELLETVRREAPDTQIIIISGYEEFEYARRALKSGVLDYLLKPIEKPAVREVLFQAARRLEDLRSSREEVCRLEKRMESLETVFSPPGDLPDLRDRRIERAVEFIRENFSRDISLEEAASEAAMNPNYFSECFRKSTGRGFCDFLTGCRLSRAAELLLKPELKIADVARQAGFRDPNYFTKIFKKATGRNPSECRVRGADPPA